MVLLDCWVMEKRLTWVCTKRTRVWAEEISEQFLRRFNEHYHSMIWNLRYHLFITKEKIYFYASIAYDLLGHVRYTRKLFLLHRVLPLLCTLTTLIKYSSSKESCKLSFTPQYYLQILIQRIKQQKNTTINKDNNNNC